MAEFTMIAVFGAMAFVSLGVATTSLLVGAIRDSAAAARVSLLAAVVSGAAFCVVLWVTQ